jgi:hypothetical protein
MGKAGAKDSLAALHNSLNLLADGPVTSAIERLTAVTSRLIPPERAFG